MRKDRESLGSADPFDRDETAAPASGHEPRDTQTVVLSNGQSLTYHAPSCPVIAELRNERCSILVRRCPDARHIVYGSRFARSIRTAAYEADVWMTDLLIAIRATARQLGFPRLLERVIDRLPAADWSLVATASDTATDCCITVRRYVDGRYIVYGGCTRERTTRSMFRVTGPLSVHVLEDVRKVASALGAEQLCPPLLAQLHRD